MKNIPKMLWILIVLAVLLISCTNPAGQGTITPVGATNGPIVSQPKPTPIPTNNVEQVLPSWARPYDLESLTWEADLIIEGTVVGIQETRAVSTAIYTDYRVDISRVLKSYPSFRLPSVVVVQLGGSFQGNTQIVEGDEPYQVGDKVF